MSDVSYRVMDSEKLIEAINKGSYDINLTAIMALGAALTENVDQMYKRWVSCADDPVLPDAGQDVLLSIKVGNHEWVGEGCRLKDGSWFQYCNCVTYSKDEVVAWTPLPKPFKKGDKE